MIALLSTIDMALYIYMWIVIISIIFSWLYMFNVINSSNQFVSTVGRILYQVTEPVLAPIRRILPPISGFDFSPIILFLIIFFLRTFIRTSLMPMFY